MTNKDVKLIENLLTFLQEGFQNPIQFIRFIQSKAQCSTGNCKTKGCERLIPYFYSVNPWGALNTFFDWCREWYAYQRYEETINAVFTLSRVEQFLVEKMEWKEQTISKYFNMEFKGGGNLKDSVPLCLRTGKSSVCIEKIFQNHQMCCDIFLEKPFPFVVAEVKVVVSQTKKNIYSSFLNDIEKCKEWLQPDTSPFIKKKLVLHPLIMLWLF